MDCISGNALAIAASWKLSQQVQNVFLVSYKDGSMATTTTLQVCMDETDTVQDSVILSMGTLGRSLQIEKIENCIKPAQSPYEKCKTCHSMCSSDA